MALNTALYVMPIMHPKPTMFTAHTTRSMVQKSDADTGTTRMRATKTPYTERKIDCFITSRMLSCRLTWIARLSPLIVICSGLASATRRKL